MLNFAKKIRQEKGDTLIEVLFAVTVFSFIVVSAMSLMNQGVAASQRSLEITTVRQQMDGQAETLRFLHESYIHAYKAGFVYNTSDALTSPGEEYYKLIQFVQASGRTASSQFGGTATCVVPSDKGKDFIMNPVAATMVNTSMKATIFQKASTFAQLTYGAGNSLNQSQGIWIEAIRSPSNGTTAGYIDFHIRACWDAPGLDTPMNLGTIVRLYEPRG
jgi:type II secretory pathway pseudopilin PulG